MSIQKIIRADNQPFAIIPNSAIRNPEISTGAFRLLAYLMSHKDGYELTYEQIERQTTLGRWAINQAAENLTALGYLEVRRPKGADGRFGPKHWVIMDPDSEPVEPYLSTVGNSTVDEPHMEKSTDNKENYLNKKTTNKDIYAQNEFERVFEEFYEIYPRKVGKDLARKTMFKLLTAGTDSFTILAGVQRLASDPNLPEKQYIPHPGTWLSEGRWNDEPYPERKRTPEELEFIRQVKYQQQRAAELKAAQEVAKQSQEATRRAVPAPKCEHGKSIVSCLTCIKSVH